MTAVLPLCIGSGADSRPAACVAAAFALSFRTYFHSEHVEHIFAPAGNAEGAPPAVGSTSMRITCLSCPHRERIIVFAMSESCVGLFSMLA